jgi:hypothetical protein
VKKNHQKPATAKNPGGRPRLPDEKRKDKRLDDVRFSAEELAKIRAVAAKSGESWSAWVRRRLGLS